MRWRGRRGRCRRLVPALAVLLATALGPGTAPAQQQETPVLVVSRERVLEEAAPADRLNDAEAAMTAELQARVDRAKAELAAEEQELTELRATLPPEEFERRVRDFDRRVRNEREITQRRAAALQTAFRQARQTLVEALVPILVTLSRERGARLVLDSDQILVAHPSIDVTEEAIALMARVPMPALPALDALEPPAGEPEPEMVAPDEAQQGVGPAGGASRP